MILRVIFAAHTCYYIPLDTVAHCVGTTKMGPWLKWTKLCERNPPFLKSLVGCTVRCKRDFPQSSSGRFALITWKMALALQGGFVQFWEIEEASAHTCVSACVCVWLRKGKHTKNWDLCLCLYVTAHLSFSYLCVSYQSWKVCAGSHEPLLKITDKPECFWWFIWKSFHLNDLLLVLLVSFYLWKKQEATASFYTMAAAVWNSTRGWSWLQRSLRPIGILTLLPICSLAMRKYCWPVIVRPFSNHLMFKKGPLSFLMGSWMNNEYVN